MLRCGLDGFAAQKNRLVFLTRLAMHILGPCQLGCFDVNWIFLQHKRPAWFHIHAGLYCEPEGLSPEGVLSYPTSTKPHRTREPRGPSPSGGKTPANLLSLEYPRALWARSGVQGVTPCLEEDADHAAVAFVDDLAEGLLHFFLSVHWHAHQLVGKALPHQLVQALAEEVRVPDGLGVVLELLQ